jgi:hypothetical protein
MWIHRIFRYSTLISPNVLGGDHRRQLKQLRKNILTTIHIDQAHLRKRGTPDRDAHTQRLPSDPGFLWNGCGRANNTTGDEALAVFIHP